MLTQTDRHRQAIKKLIDYAHPNWQAFAWQKKDQSEGITYRMKENVFHPSSNRRLIAKIYEDSKTI